MRRCAVTSQSGGFRRYRGGIPVLGVLSQERAMQIVEEDSHAVPASSWADTEAYRGELRRSAEQRVLRKLSAAR